MANDIKRNLPEQQVNTHYKPLNLHRTISPKQFGLIASSKASKSQSYINHVISLNHLH